MNKRFCWIVAAAALIAPASAMGLDTRRVFDVTMMAAADRERGSGSWYFEFDTEERAACFYAVEWVNPSETISTDCVFKEWKVHGRRSCLRNAAKSFFTILEVDGACQGFDGSTGLLQEVTALVLGESMSDELSGVIAMDAPFLSLRGITARARTDP